MLDEEALGEAGDDHDDAEHDHRQDDVRDRRVGGVLHRRRHGEAGRRWRHRPAEGGHLLEPGRMLGTDDMRRGRSERHPEDPVDADPHQRDADHQDDRAGDHRREEPQHPAGEGRDQHADDAGGDDRAEDHPSPLGARMGQRDRHHRPDRGEGDPHHHRHAHAEPGREAERLQDRDDPAAEEVGGDQEGDVLGRELQRPPDDQRHGDGAGVHDEHVLQAEREQLRRRQHLVDGMDCGHAGSPVSGQQFLTRVVPSSRPHPWRVSVRSAIRCVQCGGRRPDAKQLRTSPLIRTLSICRQGFRPHRPNRKDRPRRDRPAAAQLGLGAGDRLIGRRHVEPGSAFDDLLADQTAGEKNGAGGCAPDVGHQRVDPSHST